MFRPLNRHDQIDSTAVFTSQSDARVQKIIVTTAKKCGFNLSQPASSKLGAIQSAAIKLNRSVIYFLCRGFGLCCSE